MKSLFLHFIGLFMAVALVTACIPFTKDESTFAKVEQSFLTAKQQLDIYAALPVCSAEVKVLCHKQATVEKLQGYLTLVEQQIELARQQIAAGEDSTVAERRALTTLGTLFAIYAAQALSKQ